MDLKTIAVIGAGTMGRGIAYAAAVAGYRTILADVAADILEKAMGAIRQSLDEGIARGKVTLEQKGQALNLLSVSRSVEEAAAPADLIIEAAPEDMPLKAGDFPDALARGLKARHCR